ncbi:DUF1491 family protein [Rhizobium sp. SSA_523]|uniref:DUF1491 family protein n=1 Tax=Rhizobium sp. SSA_523 TaxID=2952477 RepID=UPI0020905640|nr:DUF1491 family protein [Rhizobium sp. SSA_523]MCO5730953.1 DUF1491 family protein [Rhizobium sp. SSA_523]WKC24238.1 DUF1491 family protein [Rhizobium sp. SSA_523]
MRLRSDLVVSALIRRVFSMGGFAAVDHRGADEAGAIFIRQRHRDGLEDLFGPAPQILADEGGARRFERRLTRAEPDAVAALMEKERRFDPDLWLVELEIDDIGDLIEVTDGQP